VPRILPVTVLTGRHVALEPLRIDHVDEIVAAGSGDRDTFALTHVPDGVAAATSYVGQLLADAAAVRAAAFVQRRLDDGAVVGCTRFMNPAWPLGRDLPDEVEVGGTWLAASAQRTGVNTDAKLLLLTHAFESWGAQRVAICTDARNDRSRRAIERLGATFEGVMRRHRPSALAAETGRLRDTAMYSITNDDWPSVRATLGDASSRAGRHD
jgi:RimJ/RimL family protein N-acetyltransferase